MPLDDCLRFAGRYAILPGEVGSLVGFGARNQLAGLFNFRFVTSHLRRKLPLRLERERSISSIIAR